MHAGLDIGTTLTKAVWKENGAYRFASTAENSLASLVSKLKEAHVNTVHLAGIGYLTADFTHLQSFNLMHLPGDPIATEKKLQAQGVQHLLEPFPMQNYFLASIGTGTSYAVQRVGRFISIPIGSALGGGFIQGLGQALGISDYDTITKLSLQGQCLDLLIQDKLPATKGTALGQFVLAHYGAAYAQAPNEDILATAVHTVAVGVVRDIAILSATKLLLRGITDVIYIGSVVSKNKRLKEALTQYTVLIGK